MRASCRTTVRYQQREGSDNDGIVEALRSIAKPDSYEWVSKNGSAAPVPGESKNGNGNLAERWACGSIEPSHQRPSEVRQMLGGPCLPSKLTRICTISPLMRCTAGKSTKSAEHQEEIRKEEIRAANTKNKQLRSTLTEGDTQDANAVDLQDGLEATLRKLQ